MLLRTYALILIVVYSTYAAAVSLSPTLAVIPKAAGSTFTVNCTSRSSITWVATPPEAMPVTGASVSPNGDNISTLTFTNVTISKNGAEYRCKEEPAGNDATFTLMVFEVSRTETEFKYNGDNVLSCSVRDTSLSFTYSWAKDGKPIKELKGSDDKWEYTEHPNGTLVLTKVSRDMAGVWTCMASYNVSGQTHVVEIDVDLWAKPYVIPFEKSKNLVQDEKLSVECSVLGHPKPAIVWLKDNVLIKNDDHYKLEPADSYAGESIDDARIIISSVDFDDAGQYTCMAVSTHGGNTTNATQPLTVRVKDKLAALWPFLGIVAEVVILCTIIFIYEKKRNKDAAAEESPAQDGTTPEKMSEGVRHRGSNNPRA